MEQSSRTGVSIHISSRAPCWCEYLALRILRLTKQGPSSRQRRLMAHLCRDFMEGKSASLPQTKTCSTTFKPKTLRSRDAGCWLSCEVRVF